MMKKDVVIRIFPFKGGGGGGGGGGVFKAPISLEIR